MSPWYSCSLNWLISQPNAEWSLLYEIAPHFTSHLIKGGRPQLQKGISLICTVYSVVSWNIVHFFGEARSVHLLGLWTFLFESRPHLSCLQVRPTFVGGLMAALSYWVQFLFVTGWCLSLYHTRASRDEWFTTATTLEDGWIGSLAAPVICISVVWIQRWSIYIQCLGLDWGDFCHKTEQTSVTFVISAHGLINDFYSRACLGSRRACDVTPTCAFLLVLVADDALEDWATNSHGSDT